MKARLTKLWQDLLGSYYFIPALMALAAILLAVLTSHLDKALDDSAMRKLGWFYSNKADGARAILTTIAGSMITVAGVTFSMTMVAVSSASSQFGPRLIGNFMRDKGNQFTLGTFTATFVYCLLILRIARTGDGGSAEDAIAEFVPNISLLTAIALALASVAVLIYFIHHIPETLNVGNITAKVGKELRASIHKPLFCNVGREPEAEKTTGLDLSKLNYVSICADSDGYIQTVDGQSLLNTAKKYDGILELIKLPGDFIVEREVIAKIYADIEDEEQCSTNVRSCFALGHERTAHQNTLFLADELVEILGRALSPGINDPYTAINCIHWFKSTINVFSQSAEVPQYRCDQDEKLRLKVMPLSYDKFVSVLCDKSRPYVCTDLNTSIAMLEMLEQCLSIEKNHLRKDLLVIKIKHLVDDCEYALKSEHGRKIISAKASSILKEHQASRRATVSTSCDGL